MTTPTSSALPRDASDGELKPCPFCGETPDINGPATFQEIDGAKWGAVVCCCTGPEVRTGYGPVSEWRDDAIKAWNTRAPIQEWRPIAEADRNGPPILGWDPYYLMRVMKADTTSGSWLTDLPYDFERGGRELRCEPTHFIPLPAPPSPPASLPPDGDAS